MKAVRFNGVGDVSTDDVDRLKPGAHEALVKIIYGGVCGSDLHIYREGMFVQNVPETMGHEFIGRIVGVPNGTQLKVGDIVVGDPRVPCLKCLACQQGDFHRCAELGFIGEVSPGAFAEYLTIDPQKLVRLNYNIDLKQGALAEPLAVAIHACRNIVESAPEKVLVAGAGPIGLLTAYLLKKQYDVSVVAVADIDEYRLNMAGIAGADKTLRSIADTAGEFDCIVDAVGITQVFDEMLAAVAPGGTIYISAIYEKLPVFDVNLLVGNEIMIKGNNAYSFEDLEEAANVLNSGRFDFSWIVSRVLPIEQAPEAFELLTAKEKKDLKVLIEVSK